MQARTIAKTWWAISPLISPQTPAWPGDTRFAVVPAWKIGAGSPAHAILRALPAAA